MFLITIWKKIENSISPDTKPLKLIFFAASQPNAAEYVQKYT